MVMNRSKLTLVSSFFKLHLFAKLRMLLLMFTRQKVHVIHTRQWATARLQQTSSPFLANGDAISWRSNDARFENWITAPC